MRAAMRAWARVAEYMEQKSTNRVFRPSQPGASASAPSRAASKQARV